MPDDSTSLEPARRAFARRMAEAAEWDEERFEHAVLAVPREAYLPAPPWHLIDPGLSQFHRSTEAADLYRDVLVALDISKGINNGQPTLHAAWIGKARPRPGETVVHVGAGMGYYTAILAALVAPGGKAIAYEIEAALAEAAARNLAHLAHVEVRPADAVSGGVLEADIIYVNAGVVAPPLGWLEALKPGGRLVFPWRPRPDFGVALLVARRDRGFDVEPFSPAFFIPCVGASDDEIALRAPTRQEAAATRSLWLARDRPADGTATAIYRDFWFSSEPAE